MLPTHADVVVIGAGIVGLATARALQLARPELAVVVVDKESQSAAHQSGHNSGVVHAGIYYRPGSRKAQLCREGRAELLDWCDRHGVEWRGCGKVVVATEPAELAPLDRLEQQAIGNGVTVARLSSAQLVELEPHAFGLAALHVPETAVIDFGRVCEGLVEGIRTRGGATALNCEVHGIDRRSGEIVVRTSRGDVRAGQVANCAGLHSDRVTRMAGDDPGVRILAFRGEYHELTSSARRLVRALIYPVPDPRFPFLGVHFTRGLDGSVHAGPNAVLALSREGYRRRDVRRDDLVELATHASSWRLASRYWRDGAAEVAQSLSRRRLTRALQRLVPELGEDDLRPAGSGVRAQAVARDGRLLDDFAFAGDDRVVHVVNAPSPAATASLAIGRVVAARLLGDGADSPIG
jgi:(S)-2-hydroxyglutarate dehydrogenase